MATVAQLNAELGLDIKPFVEGADEGVSAAKQFGSEIMAAMSGATTSIAELYQSLDNLQAAQAKLPAGSANYEALGASIAEVTAQIEVLEVAQERELQIGAQVAALDKRLTTEALAKAAAEKEAAAATTQGATASNTLSTALGAATKGFSFLRQAAYLIPGIGIAGIFNLAFEAIQKVVEETGLFTSKTKEATAAEKELNQEMARAAQEAGQQIAKVSELVAVLSDQSVNLTEKNKALKDLKSINDNYFGQLKIEDGLVKGLSTAYEQYAENIFRVAKAKAAEGELTKLGASLVEVTARFNEANDRLTQLSVKESFFGADKAKASFAELQKILQSDFLTLQQVARVSQLTGLSEREISTLIQDRAKYRDTELRTLGRMNELSQLVANNDLGKVIGGTGADKVNQIDQAIKKLAADLVAIQTLGTLNKTPLIKIESDQLQAMQATLKRLIELGLTVDSIPVKKLVIEIKDLQFKIDPNGLQKTDALAKLLPKNPILINPNEAVDRQLNIADALTKQLQDKQLANKKKNEQQSLKDTALYLQKEAKLYEAIGNEIKNAFSGVFTDLFTKGKLSFEGLAQSMEKLLANLAATAAEAAILSLILSSITGGTNIAGALGSQGTGFLSLFKSLIPHAEGGVFTGPTVIGNHIFGERGPEAIVPLNGNMDKIFAGNNRAPVVMDVVLKGNDLVLVQNRQNRYNRRNYGNFDNG